MKTILVVDDNAMCREPLAAVLRLKGYQALEAANGQEALRITRTQKPDLILLDVAMPVVDGLTFLGELRSRPGRAQIPVIMLTGSSDRGTIIAAAKKGIAGYLLKTNFSTVELMSRVQSLIGPPEAAAITQPVVSGMTPEQQTPTASVSEESSDIATKVSAPGHVNRLTKSKVLGRLTQEIELRSIAPVLQYVIALTRSSASTLDDIAAAIRQDQALSLKVLRVSNSSIYRRGRTANSLVEATQRIGVTAVRNAVIAILAIEHFEQVTESGLIPQRFWEHSLATGVLAEMIGEAAFHKSADHLFLAGLLHDVGRMVLSSIYPTEYAAVLATAAEKDVGLESVEQETFELSHIDVTRHLLTQWNMPSSVVAAASLHQSPIDKLRNMKQDAQSILAVALANRLAHALVLGDSGNARLLPFHEFASELGLDNKTIDTITTAALQRTTDTQVFYASQSSQKFCNPLALELANTATSVPQVVVLGPDFPSDPFSLFFKQLGWLGPQRPTVALIFARAQFDFTRYLPELKKLDSAGQGAIAVIAATADGTIRVPAEWSAGRHIETIVLPCGYSHLVDAVVRCSRPVAPGPALTTGG